LVDKAKKLVGKYYLKNPKPADVEKDAYDLVDVWLMIPFLLENMYSKRILAKSSIRGWNSRLNRYLIPRKYVIAMQGVDKYIKEQEDGGVLLYGHPSKFKLMAKFPPIGPPLGFWGSHKERAKRWVDVELGKGIAEEEVEKTAELESMKQEIRMLRRRMKREEKSLETAYEKMQEKEGTPEYDAAKKVWARHKTKLREVNRELEQAWKEYKRAKGED